MRLEDEKNFQAHLGILKIYHYFKRKNKLKELFIPSLFDETLLVQ
jgi:hypothetical protein